MNIDKYVMLCAIWCHLYNLNVKSTRRGVMLLAFIACLLLQLATLLKVTLPHGCFSLFLNCTNGTRLRKVSHISEIVFLCSCFPASFSEIDARNVILFQTKVFSRKIKETRLARIIK